MLLLGLALLAVTLIALLVLLAAISQVVGLGVARIHMIVEWCRSGALTMQDRPHSERRLAHVTGALISVVLGGARGGVARYFISGFVAKRVGETFPLGTLFINVSGAFVIGILGALAENSTSVFCLAIDPGYSRSRAFLGCYATVSSFSLNVLSLARDGQARQRLRGSQGANRHLEGQPRKGRATRQGCRLHRQQHAAAFSRGPGDGGPNVIRPDPRHRESVVGQDVVLEKMTQNHQFAILFPLVVGVGAVVCTIFVHALACVAAPNFDPHRRPTMTLAHY